jgi:DNA-directed RNA polymerase subunit RPC12/RpoP
MSTKQLILLGLGMIAVSVGLLIYSSAMTQNRIGSARPVEEGRCPECGREIPRSMGGECPYCKMLQGGGGKGAGKATEVRRFTPTDGVLLFLMVFLAGGGGYLLYRSSGRKVRRPKPEEPTFYLHCPNCKRKVRYSASQVGRDVLCPTCRHTLSLPVPRGW